MKRHGNLWDTLVSYPHLLRSTVKAARGKRKLAGVARFLIEQERELGRLQAELRAGTWMPSPYHTFRIHEPKTRWISAAPFRDRVVHHALVGVLAPIFENGFIFDSYACRVGKGTHAAVNRYMHFARTSRCRYVLKCDLSKYFPSIDHERLKQTLARKIKDRRVLELAGRIIDHPGEIEPVCFWFPGDDLFAPTTRPGGLPLGNQTSQFFANVYLDGFDHWVKEVLRARFYLRYVDDFVIFGNDRHELRLVRDACRDYLADLRLELPLHKCILSRVRDGIRFLGYRVFPTRRRLPRETITRWRRRLRHLAGEHAAGRLDEASLRRRLTGLLGHAMPAHALGLLGCLLTATRSAGEPS